MTKGNKGKQPKCTHPNLGAEKALAFVIDGGVVILYRCPDCDREVREETRS